jgi:hypothetical protein
MIVCSQCTQCPCARKVFCCPPSRHCHPPPVIASAAKQSRPLPVPRDCHVAPLLAMTGCGGHGPWDCHVAPLLAMTGCGGHGPWDCHVAPLLAMTGSEGDGPRLWACLLDPESLKTGIISHGGTVGTGKTSVASLNHHDWPCSQCTQCPRARKDHLLSLSCHCGPPLPSLWSPLLSLRPPPTRHCERSEAIPVPCRHHGDCHVAPLLAMTGEEAFEGKPHPPSCCGSAFWLSDPLKPGIISHGGTVGTGKTSVASLNHHDWPCSQCTQCPRARKDHLLSLSRHCGPPPVIASGAKQSPSLAGTTGIATSLRSSQ